MEKIRKPMTEEALQKLAMAREKANAKRKEMAAERSKQKEQLVQAKLKEQQDKMDKNAEIEAKKRLPLQEIPCTPEVEAETEVETEVVEPPPKIKKAKRKPVVIEHSDDSDSEDDIRDARVYFVKRKKEDPTPECVHTEPPPDPYAKMYASMFGEY